MSIQFKAEKREKFGTSEARRIKNSGRIPAVIYSKDSNIHLTIDGREFTHEYFKGSALTSPVEISFDGKKVKAIAHKIELDPVSDHPIHVDFFNCDESESIRAKPKLVFVNAEKSPGLKSGGFLHIVKRRVEVSCAQNVAVPEKIEIDVGSMYVGSKVRALNLNLPAGVKLSKKGDFLIASIIGRGKTEDEAAKAAAESSTGTASAKVDEKKSAEKK